MIFKSEEPNIKRLATETTPIVHDLEQPYDFRKELTDEIKAGMQSALTREETSVSPNDYIRLDTYMKALDIPTPPPSDMIDMGVRNLVSAIFDRWKKDTKKFMSGNVQGLLHVAQFDRSALIKSPHYPQFMPTLKAQAEATTLTPAGMVALRFLDPSFQPPARRSDVGIPKLHNFQNNRKELMNVLQSLVLARLSGQIPRIGFDGDDWRVINALFAEYRTQRKYRLIAMLAYYIRVINAEEIRFGSEGLRITDPVPTEEQRSPPPKEKPQQRNI